MMRDVEQCDDLLYLRDVEQCDDLLYLPYLHLTASLLDALKG
jgi:hypothetical protein